MQVNEVAGPLSSDSANMLKKTGHTLIDATTMLKHCRPAYVLLIPILVHCSLICLICLGKSSLYFCVCWPGNVLCVLCKESNTACLLVSYLYSFSF